MWHKSCFDRPAVSHCYLTTVGGAERYVLRCLSADGGLLLCTQRWRICELIPTTRIELFIPLIKTERRVTLLKLSNPVKKADVCAGCVCVYKCCRCCPGMTLSWSSNIYWEETFVISICIYPTFLTKYCHFFNDSKERYPVCVGKNEFVLCTQRCNFCIFTQCSWLMQTFAAKRSNDGSFGLILVHSLNTDTAPTPWKTNTHTQIIEMLECSCRCHSSFRKHI